MRTNPDSSRKLTLSSVLKKDVVCEFGITVGLKKIYVSYKKIYGVVELAKYEPKKI